MVVSILSYVKKNRFQLFFHYFQKMLHPAKKSTYEDTFRQF